MVYAGLMLLIVPGVYILLTYGFYFLEMVDKNLGPIAALKRSAEITKGAKWSLLRLGFEFYFGIFCHQCPFGCPGSFSVRVFRYHSRIFAGNAFDSFFLHNVAPHAQSPLLSFS
jgi:uncharacterized membrane protein